MFSQSINPTEKEFIPHHSRPVQILMLHEDRKNVEEEYMWDNRYQLHTKWRLNAAKEEA